ncbi:MAG: prepilin peptidase [Pseudomonadota bacterium]
MAPDLTLTALALVTLAVALWAGPVTLAMRGVLRAIGGVAAVRSYTPATIPAVSFGALGAVALAGLAFGGQAAVLASLLALLLLMVAMDLAWRWLPLEWTLAALALGLVSAVVAGDPLWAGLGALMGGGVLYMLRLAFRLTRGIEAMGLGDIWLAAALGAFVGPVLIGWLLGAAAGLGLLVHSAMRRRARPPAKTRYGVAYGAHLAILAPLFLTF